MAFDCIFVMEKGDERYSKKDNIKRCYDKRTSMYCYIVEGWNHDRSISCVKK
jgi:hypothetical protein